jgi:hypothetical protein
MRRERIWIMAVVAIALAVGAATVAEDVSVMFVGEEGEVVDLAELRDGETRVFGRGERQMTAARDGDEVRITREARGEASELSITCDIARDSCQVITSEDGQEVAVRIEKSRECEKGIGDCDLHDVDILALGDVGSGHQVFVKQICAGDDCDDEETVEIITTGVHDGHGLLMLGEGGSHGIHVASDKVRLGCPEGDASIWVDKEEAGETFLCPKHSVPMEKKIDAKQRRIVIERD